MGMTVEDEGPHDLGFLWENQSWGLSNSDDSGETKEKLDIEMAPPPNQLTEEAKEGEAVVNNKRRRAIRNGRRAMTSGEGKDGKCREGDHELHIWTERERRKKMRNMFASLHALLPQLPSKADKSSIVDEAVSYIKSLQQTVDKLEKQKQERNKAVSPIGCESSVINPQWNPYDSSREALIVADQGSSNNFGGAVGAIRASKPSNSFSSDPRQPVVFKTWASPNVVLNIFGDEAQFCICADTKPGLFTIIAFVLEKHKIDVISASILCNRNGNRYMVLAHASKALLQFAEVKTVEETFKRAAGEIMMWLS